MNNEIIHTNTCRLFFFFPNILQFKKPCLQSTSNPRIWQLYNVKSISVWIKPNPVLYTYTGTACHIWEGWGASASMLLVEMAVCTWEIFCFFINSLQNLHIAPPACIRHGISMEQVMCKWEGSLLWLLLGGALALWGCSQTQIYCSAKRFAGLPVRFISQPVCRTELAKGRQAVPSFVIYSQ